MGQRLFHRRAHDPSGKLEDFAALHLHEVAPVTDGLLSRRLRRTTGGNPEQIGARTIATYSEAENAARLAACTQHDGTGSIAKEHTGSAVGIIDHARKHLYPNDQYMLGATIRDELVRGRECIEKAAAGSLN